MLSQHKACLMHACGGAADVFVHVFVNLCDYFFCFVYLVYKRCPSLEGPASLSYWSMLPKSWSRKAAETFICLGLCCRCWMWEPFAQGTNFICDHLKKEKLLCLPHRVMSGDFAQSLLRFLDCRQHPIFAASGLLLPKHR